MNERGAFVNNAGKPPAARGCLIVEIIRDGFIREGRP